MKPTAYDLLTAIREIYQEADFTEDDMGMDLGERLCNIQAIAESCLKNSGWKVPERIEGTDDWESEDEVESEDAV